MWNNFSFDQFLPHVNLENFIPHLSEFIPAPDSFYSKAGSVVVAAAVGGVYGLIGRVIYPKTGISPLHYALWFAIAFQIKQCILFSEDRFSVFLGGETYLEELEDVPEDELGLHDQIRYHVWKVMQLKNRCIKAVDLVFFKIFHIRPYSEIDVDNVEDASFLEMCRYRMWPVFKTTILDTLSFAVAHGITNRLGFALPSRTAVPLFIVIQSIVKDIILVPALYAYVRFCNHLADKLGEGDERAATYRAVWFRRFLPAL